MIYIYIYNIYDIYDIYNKLYILYLYYIYIYIFKKYTKYVYLRLSSILWFLQFFSCFLLALEARRKLIPFYTKF